MPSCYAIATALIAHCEGCRLAPYQDLRGDWTIGYGNRFSIDGSPVTTSTQPIQAYQATALLRDTLLMDLGPAVARMIQPVLSDAQMGALLSLAYNIGCAAFRTSTMLCQIDHGEIEDAADQFQRWAYADHRLVKGLVVRRALERAVYLGTVSAPVSPWMQTSSVPHPVFTSTRTTDLTADDLNAQQLTLLRPTRTVSA